MKNSNIQRAIPAHSVENLATAAGRRNITTNEIAITLMVTFLWLGLVVIVVELEWASSPLFNKCGHVGRQRR